jgi:hypothetical protein
MIKLLAALLLIAAPSYASPSIHADNFIPKPCFERNTYDGLWEICGMVPFVNLEDSDRVYLRASFAVATRLELQHPSYGVAIGTPVSTIGHSMLVGIASISSFSPEAPKWMGKLGDIVELDYFVLYRPVTGYDDHHPDHGFGGQLSVAFSDLQFWARGTPGTSTTPEVKGL